MEGNLGCWSFLLSCRSDRDLSGLLRVLHQANILGDDILRVLKIYFPLLMGTFNTCCYSKIANLSWPRVRRAGYLPKSFFKAFIELCQRALNPVVCDTVTKDFLTMS